eukprot:GSChrysophyteH2.ASY1.ANO1.1559.1 assembled CDS
MQKVSNVRAFAPSLTIDVLHHVLPAQFFEGEVQLVWQENLRDDNKWDEITAFVVKFWNYASVRPDIISAVAQQVAIVPVISLDGESADVAGDNPNVRKGFASLSQMSHLVALKGTENILPASLVKILQNVGLLTIFTGQGFPNLESMPPVFWEYVHKPSRSGIIKGIENYMRLLGTKNTKKENDSRSRGIDHLSGAERDELFSFFALSAPASQLTEAEIKAIKSFSIFTTFSSNTSKKLNDDGKSLYFPINGDGGGQTLDRPDKVKNTLIPKKYIRHTNAAEFALLQKIGVTVKPLVFFFMNEFVKAIEHHFKEHAEDTQHTLLVMLGEIPQMVENKPDVASYFNMVKFIPCGTPFTDEKNNTKNEDGVIDVENLNLLQPNQVFDPAVKELQDLLDASFFPHAALQRSDHLAALRMLGMQQTMEWDGVLTCARRIERLYKLNVDVIDQKILENIRNRGRNLLRFLNGNIDSLLDVNIPKDRGMFSSLRSMIVGKKKEQVPVDEHLKTLKSLYWVPVYTERTKLCMPVPSVEEARSVVAKPERSRLNSDIWLCSASYRIVAEPVTNSRLKEALGWTDKLSLSIIAISNTDEDNTTWKSSSDEQDAKETISVIIPQLYQMLHSGLGSPKHSTEEDNIKQILANKKWIWVGSTFVNPSKVSLTADASPYLYRLPQDLRVYGHLLRAFSVKSSFSSSDYESVLVTMAQETGQAPAINEKTKKKAIALTPEKLDLACSLITFLSADGHVTSRSVKDIYAPDNTGCLALTKDLINDDVPWMSGTQFITVRKGCRFIHPNISTSVAEKIGVKSFRQSLLDRNMDSENMFQGIEGAKSDDMQAFGQAESLTKRLKTILDMYPDGNPIFSELIQNADDAGATSVRIMLDENTYPTESLLSSKMASLQGPSLIVWNDATFSENDYRSLARIGHGHKLDKVSTTGRFGLGFNSTYHLTDTPTFVSGEHLVIFDPHCTHAPGANVNQPGLKVKCVGNHLYTTFPDQFKPFEFFGCNFEKSYEGTLFRFPLRTSSMARKSEVSSRAYTQANAHENIEHLAKQLSQYLLFLRSVRTIEIYQLGPEETKPILLHKAVSRIESDEHMNDQKIMSYFDKNEGKHYTKEQFYQILSNTRDSNLPWSFRDLSVRSFKYDERGSHDLVGFEDSRYGIVTGLCGGDAKKMACDPSTWQLKLIPLGSVAACISRSAANNREDIVSENLIKEKMPTLDGQAYSFLPLPVHTNLPVHVNAYWELTSNRRDIWQGDDTQGEAKVRSNWNIHVMKDILGPLYARLMMKMIKVELGNDESSVQKNEELLRLFPCPMPVSPWNTLAISFFRSMENEKVLWSKINQGEFVKLVDAVLLEKTPASDNDEDPNAVSKKLDELEDLLISESLKVARVPIEILEPLVNLCISKRVCPQLSKNQVISRKVNMKNVLFLLDYCFFDIHSKNYEELHDLPLVPLQNGKLGVFKVSKNDKEHRVLYLMSEVEEKLLAAHASHIIVARSLIPSKVYQVLKDPVFEAMMNVRRLGSTDFMNLLNECFPKSVFLPRRDSTGDASEGIIESYSDIYDRSSSFNDEWLNMLWKYILSEGILTMFSEKESPPIIPIIRPSCFHEGQFVARIDQNVPILHMNYRNAPHGVIDCLADLGVYIVDPSPLGSLAFNEEVSRLSSSTLPKDLLKHLNARKDFVNHRESYDERNLEVLRKLPIWLDKNQFHTLMLESDEDIKIPPLGIDPDFLNSKYIRLRHRFPERDRICYQLLGVKQELLGVFYTKEVIPGILAPSESDNRVYENESKVDAVVIQMLNSLSKCEEECSDFMEQIRTSAVIRANDKALHKPSTLYDPQLRHLQGLLPKKLFPLEGVLDSHTLVVALKTLGLRTSVDSDSVLATADFGSHPNTENVVRRALGLVRYLEKEIATVVGEVDPEGYKRFKEWESPKESADEQKDVDNTHLGGGWTTSLRSYKWIPVFSRPNISLAVEALPWSKHLHSVPLASPENCITSANTWLCSSTKRVSTCDVQNVLLREILGWNDRPSGRACALQLVSLQHQWENIDESIKLQLVVKIETVIHNLMARLLECMKSETAAEVEQWKSILSNRRIIWIEDCYVEPGRVAFKGLSGVDAEPFLFVVREPMLPYRPLLTLLGVNESFGPRDLAQMMTNMRDTYHTNNRDIPLTTAQVEIAVGILKVLANLLKESLRPLYIPDRDGYLLDSASLTYDDTPWISGGISGSKNKKSSLRYTHKGLQPDEARVLGAKSLREHLFDGTDIICPVAKNTRKVLGNDHITDALVDLLSLADSLAAKSFDVTFDARVHKSESLLHPGLGEVQGPALVIRINGPVLRSEELSKVHKNSSAPRDGSNNGSGGENFNVPYPTSGKRLLSAFAVTDCLQIISGSEFYVFDPCGLHLFGAEVVQLQPGKKERNGPGPRAQRCGIRMRKEFPDQFAPFTSLDHIGFAQHAHASESYPGLLIRMPLREIPSGLSYCVPNESMIKRSVRSLYDFLEGSIVFSNSLIEGSFSHIAHGGSNAPVFDFKLRLRTNPSDRNSRRDLLYDKTWKKTTWFSSYDYPKKMYSVEIEKTCNNSSWLFGKDSAEMLSLFEKDNTDTAGLKEEDSSAANTSTMKSPAFVEKSLSEWCLVSAHGAGLLRDIALERNYRNHKLSPFCTIALRIMPADELNTLDKKSDIGLIYCNGGPVSVTGLPFHVEGPFLQNISERLVPLGFQQNVEAENRQKRASLAVWNDTAPVASKATFWSSAHVADDIKPLNKNEIETWNAAIIRTIYNELYLRAIEKIPQCPGFYKYWPFLNPMTAEMQMLTLSSKLFKMLFSKSLFLGRSGFQNIKDVILPTKHTSVDALTYMQSMMSVGFCPVQVSVTCTLSNIAFRGLTPDMLRDNLKRDPKSHCLRLRSRYGLIYELLKYCFSDIQEQYKSPQWSDNVADSVKKKLYVELQGVPLLIMADGSLGAFPRFPNDRLSFAPPSLHILLRQLRKSFIHPKALDGFDVAADPVFQQAVHMTKLSSLILKDYMHLILPDEWRHCDAVYWSGTDQIPVGILSVREQQDSHPNKEPSALMLYSLWNNLLSSEDSLSSSIADWPLVPAVRKGRKFLLSTKFLNMLLVDVADSESSTKRSHMKREIERLEHSTRGEVELPNNTDDINRDWHWTNAPSKKIQSRITSKSLGHGFRIKKTAVENADTPSAGNQGGSKDILEEVDDIYESRNIPPGAKALPTSDVDVAVATESDQFEAGSAESPMPPPP